ncbi:hypothetical protein FSC37_08760 [Piscinibacter aquaticus]|uniref:O-acyltransferase WSD1-like N-terminal domain-containing protein n=1 Tax=Piscinibacter aquaticus TaxID=392597 RepID=A0A5C6U226_9BURK|nr:hypothetical protein FSC37_08760 [Piscinibacter aquaticus]
MKQLSGLDASFLYLETAEMPMHVGALHLFELPHSYRGNFLDDMRRHIASRLPLAPALRRKLAWMPLNLAAPAWVDADPDLEVHVVGIRLPKGSDIAELEAKVGELHPVLLDRSRPLWKFHVFDGGAGPGWPEALRAVHPAASRCGGWPGGGGAGPGHPRPRPRAARDRSAAHATAQGPARHDRDAARRAVAPARPGGQPWSRPCPRRWARSRRWLPRRPAARSAKPPRRCGRASRARPPRRRRASATSAWHRARG